jgi:hypothetical protein
MRNQHIVGLALTLVFGDLLVGCSTQKVAAHRSYMLGTNGTVEATFDERHRVRELQQFNTDHLLKLRVAIVYAKQDVKRLAVFDSTGRQVSATVFTANTESNTGRGSDEPSPGWDIREDRDWSGMPGEIHDTITWYCGDDLLYRLKRIWSDDRSRVYYEATGSSGVILFTNTYVEK